MEQADENEKALQCEVAMPTLEAWPQERGGDKTKKKLQIIHGAKRNGQFADLRKLIGCMEVVQEADRWE